MKTLSASLGSLGKIMDGISDEGKKDTGLFSLSPPPLPTGPGPYRGRGRQALPPPCLPAGRHRGGGNSLGIFQGEVINKPEALVGQPVLSLVSQPRRPLW